jgi:hypothetical protein
VIHPPDVIGNYVPDAFIGMVGVAKKSAAPKKGQAPALTIKDRDSIVANHQAGGHLDGTENWRLMGMDENPRVFLINVKAYIFAAWACSSPS